MGDECESVYSCLDPLVDDALVDHDSDALTSIEEINIATDPCNADTDADGCKDGAEKLREDPTLGGTRDPLNPYDFYDVPVPTAFDGGTLDDRDGAVSIVDDVLAVLEYSGTSDGGPANAAGRQYNQDNNGDTLDDGLLYDRSVGATWSDAPDAAVSIIVDALLVLDQSGHSCQANP